MNKKIKTIVEELDTWFYIFKLDVGCWWENWQPVFWRIFIGFTVVFIILAYWSIFDDINNNPEAWMKVLKNFNE